MDNRVHPGELRTPMRDNSSLSSSAEFLRTKSSMSGNACQVHGEFPRMKHSTSCSSSQVSGEFPRMKPSMSSTSSQWSCDFPRTKHSPPPGTYVIQLPKDQIYRVPPPENARRFEYLSSRKSGGTRCHRLCFVFFAALLLLTIIAGITICFFILVSQPETPEYSVQSISIKGLDLTSSSLISPEFEIRIRVRNPNEKISFQHEQGSTFQVYRDEVVFGSGESPSFHLSAKNQTVFKAASSGSSIHLTEQMRKNLSSEEKEGRVAINLRIKAALKMELGPIKSWNLKAKVRCELVVDKLTAKPNIISENCHRKIHMSQ